MKVIKYFFNGLPVSIAYSECNLEIASKEADDGEYSIEDVEIEESAPTTDERLEELEAAFELLLSGVTE